MQNHEYRDLERRLMKIESMLEDVYDSTVKKKKICPVCGNVVRLYLPSGDKLRKGAICPVCRSLERQRALWMYFEKNPQLFEKERIRLLHFAPEGIFLNRFLLNERIEYWPVDINPDYPGIRTTADITDLPFEEEYFDLIICNHVLEHVPDEKKALSELYRVLDRKGTAVLNVPVNTNRGGDIGK